MVRTSMKKMMRDHLDVLQNIEAVLNDARQNDKGVDDRIVLEALRCAHNSDVPDALRTIDLVEKLIEAEEMRSDVPEPIWQECLRVVIESVRTHSLLKPGETTYLDFIANFM